MNLSRSLIFAIASLALGIGLVVLVVVVAGNGGLDTRLGDDVFHAGPARERAREVAGGGPILFASLSGSRPIFLQHLGAEATEDWFAIDARSPTDSEACSITWDGPNERFVDDCAVGNTFPADGAGLVRYEVTVSDDGELIVDFRTVIGPDR